MDGLLVVEVGSLPAGISDELARFLTHALRVPCAVASVVLDPFFAFDPGRNQYDARALLQRLEETAGGARVTRPIDSAVRQIDAARPIEIAARHIDRVVQPSGSTGQPLDQSQRSRGNRGRFLRKTRRADQRSTPAPEASDPTRPERTVLGVADVDLCSPVFTFVFGEAKHAGHTAVVSLHRLRPEGYGLPADPDLLSARAHRVALHEAGHLIGLRHCREPDCVMRFSGAAEELDLLREEFCSACQEILDGTRR